MRALRAFFYRFFTLRDMRQLWQTLNRSNKCRTINKQSMTKMHRKEYEDREIGLFELRENKTQQR